MSNYDVLIPDIWRRVVTEKVLAKAVFPQHIAVERYPFAEEVNYRIEKTLAAGPKKWKLGTPMPISEMTYEKRTATVVFYADGFEIPKPAVDRMRQYGLGLDLIRREMARKAEQAGLKMDQLISDQMYNDAGQGHDLTPGTDGWDVSWDAVKNSLAICIRKGEKANYAYDTMFVSPEAYEYLLRNMPNVEAWYAEAVRTGKIPMVAGLNVIKSNNMTNPDDVLICQSRNFGVILESYPLTTRGPKEYEDEGVWRGYLFFAVAIVIDRPDAVCLLTDVCTIT